MRILLLSKALVVGAYQRKLEALAALPGVELVAAVPPAWRDERGLLRLERVHTRGYELAVEPIAFNGNFHLHFYPRLGRLLERVRPDLVHIDEEPYNFATWHALQLARRVRARSLFFSWQNLQRRYPFPFSALERQVLRGVDGAIVGNQEALAVWRAKGYGGPAVVIPQFGVDPELYAPAPPAERAGLTVGYAGRLVPEKGVDLLLRALAALPAEVRLEVRGAGPAQAALERLSAELGVAGRARFAPLLPSVEMPAFYRGLDVLALPSRTRPNWKEQFGRVLVEAMACGVPVVGAASGEIPHVIGDAGLLFPEDDLPALTGHLRALHASPALRADLARHGRARVLAHFTQEQIARATAAFYTLLLNR